MTEAEWLTCDDPRPMLAFLRDKISDRKLRLFALGCLRPNVHLWPEDGWLSSDIDLTEQFLDGREVTEYEKSQEYYASQGMEEEEAVIRDFLPRDYLREAFFDRNAWNAAAQTAMQVANQAEFRFYAENKAEAAFDMKSLTECRRTALAAQSVLFREIVGNPFRFPSFDARWHTATVTTLANAVYTDRAFDRMPILADALEDAGCTSRDILDHCRQPGVHVRGCWVVDLVLGKE